MLVIGEVWPPEEDYLDFSKGDDIDSAIASANRCRALDVKRYLLDEWHDKAGIVEMEEALLELSKKWPEAVVKLVEETANGSALCDRMEAVLTGITRFKPGNNAKEARAMIAQPMHERGMILLPCSEEARAYINLKGEIKVSEWWQQSPPQSHSNDEYVPIESRWRSYREVGENRQVDGIVDEFAKFPAGSNDDRVDAVSQTIIWGMDNPPTVTSSLEYMLETLS